MSDDFQQRGGSPWGSPPGGGGSGNGSGRGPTPPDVDKIIREFQEKIKKIFPGGSSSGGKQALLVLIILSYRKVKVNLRYPSISVFSLVQGSFSDLLTRCI